jgi:hypothetical protein
MPTPRKPLAICGLCSVLLAAVMYAIESQRQLRPIARLELMSTVDHHDPAVKQLTHEFGELVAGSRDSCEFEIDNNMATTLVLAPGARTNHIAVGITEPVQ